MAVDGEYENIRLLVDLPVAAEHGMTKGRVLRAKVMPRPGRGGVHWQVVGDAGQEVGVLNHEATGVAGIDD